jgi:hypothetical protein
MPLYLFEFLYRDPLSGKWTKARYRAELHEIQQRYWEWETIGAPEMREPHGGTFNPFRRPYEP